MYGEKYEITDIGFRTPTFHIIHLLIISIRSPNGNLQLGWSLLYKIVNMGIDGVNLGLDAINRPKRDFWRKCLGKCLEMCEMFTNFADFFKQT